MHFAESETAAAATFSSSILVSATAVGCTVHEASSGRQAPPVPAFEVEEQT